jgi:hypothetical protein
VTAKDGGRAPVPWRALIAGTGIFGGEGAAEVVHPALGAALAAADVIGPLAIALIMLAAILLGSDETVERVFRLLRWVANRPEPAAPPAETKPDPPPPRALNHGSA